MSYTWSDNAPVLGDMSPQEAAARLRSLGDEKTATELEALEIRAHSSRGIMGVASPSSSLKHLWQWWDTDCPWKNTGHEIGYITSEHPAERAQTIVSAREIEPDTTLKGKKLKITLDRFFIVAYPGGITHRILLKFFTRNQVRRTPEDIHFNMICRARDGEAANINGSPIFIGLSTGNQGIVLGCESVKVADKRDEAFLGFLDSDVFKAGLHLVSTIQPAVSLIASAAYHITKTVVDQKTNAKVQEFEMGLDFSKIPSNYKLAAGSYLVVQIAKEGQSSWDWNDWRYQNGQVVRKDSPRFLLPYNYFIFGISLGE